MAGGLIEKVRSYWEREPCGTAESITRGAPERSLAWFERIEEYRYTVEPCIHAVAQFTRHRGKRVLEVGVGAGTDHLQWARAGAECYGVDLTDAAIETTQARLSLYGLHSTLKRVDAEKLPFADNMFDVVYSWGVIHHAENPAKIIDEMRRVLKPGGIFIGMMYGRRSVLVFKMWIRHALLRGRPWRSFADIVWHHMESVGTKAYTVPELKQLFGGFTEFSAQSLMTAYDKVKWPAWLSRFFPNQWGWFITLRAVK